MTEECKQALQSSSGRFRNAHADFSQGFGRGWDSQARYWEIRARYGADGRVGPLHFLWHWLADSSFLRTLQIYKPTIIAVAILFIICASEYAFAPKINDKVDAIFAGMPPSIAQIGATLFGLISATIGIVLTSRYSRADDTLRDMLSEAPYIRNYLTSAALLSIAAIIGGVAPRFGYQLPIYAATALVVWSVYVLYLTTRVTLQIFTMMSPTVIFFRFFIPNFKKSAIKARGLPFGGRVLWPVEIERTRRRLHAFADMLEEDSALQSLDELRVGMLYFISNSYFFLYRLGIDPDSGWFTRVIDGVRPIKDETWVENEFARAFTSAFRDGTPKTAQQRLAAAMLYRRAIGEATYNGVWDGSLVLMRGLLQIVAAYSTGDSRELSTVDQLARCFKDRSDNLRSTIQAIARSTGSLEFGPYLSGGKRYGYLTNVEFNRAAAALRYQILAESRLDRTARTPVDDSVAQARLKGWLICQKMTCDVIGELDEAWSFVEGTESSAFSTLIALGIGEACRDITHTFYALSETCDFDPSRHALIGTLRNRADRLLNSTIYALAQAGVVLPAVMEARVREEVLRFVSEAICPDRATAAIEVMRTISRSVLCRKRGDHPDTEAGLLALLGMAWLRGAFEGMSDWCEESLSWADSLEADALSDIMQFLAEAHVRDATPFEMSPYSSVGEDWLTSRISRGAFLSAETCRSISRGFRLDDALAVLEVELCNRFLRSPISERGKMMHALMRA